MTLKHTNSSRSADFRSRLAQATMLLVALGISSSAANGATIYVTTLLDKISSTGGCSLKEAIYSANWHVNKAYSDVLGSYITTQCVPGTGNDRIVLPQGATLTMVDLARDPYNYTGATATPLIFSNITIEANGSLLQSDSSAPIPARAFAVGSALVSIPGVTTVTGTGSLTIRHAYISGFQATGGNGNCGGGGGMGAGGAIYVTGGQLTIENSTLAANRAIGGAGGIGGIGSTPGHPSPGTCFYTGGGGGGFSGNGGTPGANPTLTGISGGGGGGGALGPGGAGGEGMNPGAAGGGGGGGTLTGGISGSITGGQGGTVCGANGGNTTQVGGFASAACPGGGGGGGGGKGYAGGDGSYGGGGGGAGYAGTPGGNGGFGGGGGSPNGGGGFGGGGGASGGAGGAFGGGGAGVNGGAGAGLGGEMLLC